jgi:hypothetical protein
MEMDSKLGIEYINDAINLWSFVKIKVRANKIRNLNKLIIK